MGEQRMKGAGIFLVVAGVVLGGIGVIWYNSIPYYGPENTPPIIFIIIGVVLLIIGWTTLSRVQKQQQSADIAAVVAKYQGTAGSTPTTPGVFQSAPTPMAVSMAMPATTPNDEDAAAVADPALAPSTLQRIATQRPDLRAAIAAHPNASPELKNWIAAQP